MTSKAKDWTYGVSGMEAPPRGWQRSCLDRLSEAGLTRSESRSADLVLEFGRDPARTDRGAEVRWGTWSFRVDGRGTGELVDACREALLAGRHSVWAHLVATRAGGDEVVVREGRLPLITPSLRASVASIRAELELWPAYAARTLVRSGRLEGPRIARDAGVDPDAAAGNPPGTGFVRRWLRRTMCLIRTAWNRLRLGLRTLFRHDYWNVGVVRKPISAFLTPGDEGDVDWWPSPPPERFRADAFGTRRGASLLVLYEEMDYAWGRGRIVGEVQELDGGRGDGPGNAGATKRRDPGVAMEGEGHFSYPYLFEHDDELYCVPETADQRRVALYRAVDFPMSWEEVGTLLDDVAALDSTLFRHDGRWWLFFADRDAGPRHVLEAWHAPEIMGPWSPHAANPVKIDIHAARPAGTPFRHEGRLYRPAQDGARSYGEAVVINRVVELSPNRFVEEAVRRVTLPSDGPYPAGIHTLASVGPELTLVDGKRLGFSMAELGRRLGRLLRVAVP